MKFFLLPVFFLMILPAYSISLEECRSYTNEFLIENVLEDEQDLNHPYQLKNAEALAGFDTNKLGLELNNSILTKWRASCVDKPDMSVPICDNSFPLYHFMKATVTGLKTGGWDEKTKSLARTKLSEFFHFSAKEEQNMLNLHIALAVMENARSNGILNPEKKKLDILRKEVQAYTSKISAELKGRDPGCKEGDKLYRGEKAVASKVRKEFSELLKTTL